MPSRASRTIGTRFEVTEPGTITHLRFFKSKRNKGQHIGYLWTASGKRLAKARFRHESRKGWQRVKLSRSIPVKPGQTYTVSYRASRGHYSTNPAQFANGRTLKSGPLVALGGVIGRSAKPTSASSDAYLVDVVFRSSAANGPAPGADGTGSGLGIPPVGVSNNPAARGCAVNPSACNYPDATNTGVASGTALRSVPGQVSSGLGWHYDSRGWVQIDGDGAILSGVSLTVPIDIAANNVTVVNSRIQSTGESWGIALRHATNVTIANNEIFSPAASGPNRLMVGIKDIYGDSQNVLIAANDIAHTATGVQLEAGVVRDNFIHDMAMVSGDHVNGFTSNGGTAALTIQHNTVLNPLSQTDAVSLFQDFGPQANRLITDNLLSGGGYAVYAGANPGKESTATNITVSNNRFAQNYYGSSGYWGPVTAYRSGGGNAWSGNFYDSSGAAIGTP